MEEIQRQVQQAIEEAERDTVRRLNEQAQQFNGMLNDRQQAYETRIQQLANEVEALRVQAQNPQNRVKIPRPEYFDGTTRGLDVDEWLFRCSEYFSTMETPEHLKSGYASSLLRGSAASWWRLQKLQDPGAADMENSVTRWDNFHERIGKQFRRISAVTRARDELYALHHSRFSNVTEFCTQFRSTVVKIPDMTEADKLHLFCRKLNAPVRLEVLTKQPETLENAMRLAETVESVRTRAGYKEKD